MDGTKIEERIKEYGQMDETCTYSELKTAIEQVEKDIKFAEFKRQYWAHMQSDLRNLRVRLRYMQNEIKNICEICKRKPEGEEKLRSLPDGRRVCKPCWNHVADDVLLKNYNSIMHVVPVVNEEDG